MNSAPANARDTISTMSQGPYGPAPSGPAQWPVPSPSRGPSRLPTVIAIVIAVIAVAVAIGAWFRPAPKPEAPAAKTYSEQEVADAKKAVCDAYDKVFHMLDVNSRKASVNSADTFAVTVNSRLAIHTAGDYLMLILSGNPAVPSEFSNTVRELANAYQNIIIGQISDADQPQLDESYQKAEKIGDQVAQECK